MRGPMQSIIISFIVIAIGMAWMLNVMDIVPGVNWIWTAGLAGAGLLILAWGGANKLTWVIGPFLMVASALSFLRQRGDLNVEYEIPMLITALGVLMLLTAVSKLPNAGSGR